jgi:hypothetical protein
LFIRVAERMDVGANESKKGGAHTLKSTASRIWQAALRL